MKMFFLVVVALGQEIEDEDHLELGKYYYTNG
jgi:hypothetical protein